MLIILLIIAILLFFFAFIFLKNKVRMFLIILSLVIMIDSQTLLVLNEINHFSMYQKEVKVEYQLQSNNKTLEYTNETIIPVYMYQVVSNKDIINTKVNDHVYINKDSKTPVVKLVNQELFFKNGFYQFLFYFVHSNGDVISSDISFNLTKEWQLKETSLLK